MPAVTNPVSPPPFYCM